MTRNWIKAIFMFFWALYFTYIGNKVEALIFKKVYLVKMCFFALIHSLHSTPHNGRNNKVWASPAQTAQGARALSLLLYLCGLDTNFPRKKLGVRIPLSALPIRFDAAGGSRSWSKQSSKIKGQKTQLEALAMSNWCAELHFSKHFSSQKWAGSDLF